MSAPEDSANLAWSRGTEVPDGQNIPADGSSQDAVEPVDSDQSWATAWSRAAALFLVCLGLAMVILVANWVMHKSPDDAAAPTATSAPPKPSITTTVASTPDQDQRYIAALNDKGIEFRNPDVAVSNGKAVCQSLTAGQTVQQIAAQFRADSPDFAVHADDFIAVSVRAYCPQYSKLVAAI